MADSSLDQFFAKKDKSKKAKTKGKVTSEQIARKIHEDPAKKEEKSQKRDRAENATGKVSATVPSLEQEDEEWKDFEEEKERDYSGLRIQSLTLAEKEREEDGTKDGQTEDEYSDSPSQGEQHSGPWKVQSQPAAEPTAAPVPEPEPAPAPEPEPRETKPSQPLAYRPPHLRSTSARTQGPTSGGGGGRRPNHTTYDFTSEEQFPSLGAAVDNSKAKEVVDRSFTSVKHGLRNREDVSQQHVKLDLENKYSALHQGDQN